MKMLVVGTPRDVRGFALAGVEGRVAEDSADLREALRAAASPSNGVGLVLLSNELSALRPAEPRAHATGLRLPPLILLPGNLEP